MKHYPYRRAMAELPVWQKNFVALCAEAAWRQASCTLVTHSNEFESALKHPSFTAAYIAFAENAPLAALHAVCANIDSFSLQSRENAIDAAVSVQLACCAAAIDVDWVEAGLALHQAITLRPRTVASEQEVAIAFTELAKSYGRIEREYLVGTEKLATDPSVTALAQSDPGKKFPSGYHPALLSSLIEQALNAGASEEFLRDCLRALFAHAWWPSWRACFALRDDFDATLRTLARREISADEIHDQCAIAHLRAFADWEKSTELPDAPWDDDVEF